MAASESTPSSQARRRPPPWIFIDISGKPMAMTSRFETKIALITGAGSGMGRAITLRLAQEGAAVFAVDIDQGRLTETGRVAQGAVSLHQADLSAPAACFAAIEACVAEFGQLDVLG